MSQSSDGSSQIGFFGQATKLVSSMLEGGKKGKPDQPKSIQRAAAASKKVGTPSVVVKTPLAHRL